MPVRGSAAKTCAAVPPEQRKGTIEPSALGSARGVLRHTMRRAKAGGPVKHLGVEAVDHKGAVLGVLSAL